ncbi:hypothetical protein MRB53_013113 [Persea americana]|uniref:Uncharacterized protein n=1 Tax=Persea americana TaxID=3435 RepID=A0ACC2K7F7_PERAE|nr:hypothetical protein MRB53_013113 [Persea americana]
MQQPPLVLTSGRIVELKTKELGQSEVNCVKHLSYDSLFRVIVGGSGGGGALIGGAAAATGSSSSAPAAEAPPVEEKKEEKEESDDDMGFSLFD